MLQKKCAQLSCYNSSNSLMQKYYTKFLIKIGKSSVLGKKKYKHQMKWALNLVCLKESQIKKTKQNQETKTIYLIWFT